MKPMPFLTALALFAVALSGCAEKEPTTTPSTSTSVSTRPTTSSSNPATSPTNTSTAASQTVFKGVVKWASPNEEKPMTVPSGAKSLQVTADVNATAAGPYSVTGPANAEPYVEIKPASGEPTRLAFAARSGAVTTPGRVAGPMEESIASPAAGAWAVTVGGTGNNVHAYVVVVASFS